MRPPKKEIDLAKTKRERFLFSSSFLALVWFLFLWRFPFEMRYFGLLSFLVLQGVFYWWVLRLGRLEKSLRSSLKLSTIIFLPLSFSLGFTMFIFLFDWWWFLVLAAFLFGILNYIFLLIDNLFLVSVSYKAIPLLRAASTVNFLLVLLSAFLLFDAIFSFYLKFWWAALLTGGASALLFYYLIWSTVLTNKVNLSEIKVYSLVSGILLLELTVVLSWWPLGVFLRSVYLLLVFYLLAVLLQKKVRERLFKRVWMELIWLGLGAFLGLLWVTSWRA